jgi:hypothetical protein
MRASVKALQLWHSNAKIGWPEQERNLYRFQAMSSIRALTAHEKLSTSAASTSMRLQIMWA